MEFELNSNSTKFNSTIKLKLPLNWIKIQLKKIEVQIGGKGIVKYVCEYGVEKKT